MPGNLSSKTEVWQGTLDGRVHEVVARSGFIEIRHPRLP